MSAPNERSLAAITVDEVGKALARQLGQVNPVVTTSNDPLAEFLKRADGRKDTENTQYPFFYIKPRSFQADKQTAYSPARMAKSPRALMTGRLNDGSFVQFRLIPVQLPIEFGFVTNDGPTQIEFAANWVALAHAGRYNFNLVYKGVELTVWMEPQENADIVEIDQGEGINEAITTGSVLVHCFIEPPGRPQRKISTVTPVFSVELKHDQPRDSVWTYADSPSNPDKS